jgi:hypothetical protein
MKRQRMAKANYRNRVDDGDVPKAFINMSGERYILVRMSGEVYDDLDLMLQKRELANQIFGPCDEFLYHVMNSLRRNGHMVDIIKTKPLMPSTAKAGRLKPVVKSRKR